MNKFKRYLRIGKRRCWIIIDIFVNNIYVYLIIYYFFLFSSCRLFCLRFQVFLRLLECPLLRFLLFSRFSHCRSSLNLTFYLRLNPLRFPVTRLSQFFLVPILLVPTNQIQNLIPRYRLSLFLVEPVPLFRTTICPWYRSKISGSLIRIIGDLKKK